MPNGTDGIKSGSLPDGHPLKEGTPQPTLVTAADVTDHALVPRRLELLATEVREGFATLAEKILPALERLSSLASDHAAQLVELQRHRHQTDDRLAVLEAAGKKKRRKPARARKRKARK